MKIKKRLLLIVGLTFLGAFLFIPFIIAGDPGLKEKAVYQASAIFVFVSVTIAFFTGWAGLKFTDRLNIPMPVLRNWEINGKIDYTIIKSILTTSILLGVIAAGATIISNSVAGNFFHLPTNPGSLLTRVATSVWAPVITETVSHLFLLSAIVIIIKNKIAGNILSGLAFVILFHLSSSYSFALSAYISSLNFLLAILTGYLFIKKGFETAVLTHMIAHTILLVVNI